LNILPILPLVVNFHANGIFYPIFSLFCELSSNFVYS
jgi:hypothetical protein